MKTKRIISALLIVSAMLTLTVPTVLASPPYATTPISPSGTLSTWDNIFTWTGESGATFYLIGLYDDEYNTLGSQWITPSSASCEEPDLSCIASPGFIESLSDGTYYWRILPYFADYGLWTDYLSFTLASTPTDTPPPPPTLTDTPIPSDTPTGTLTPATPTFTPTETLTPSPTFTPTETVTPSPTFTPSITPTYSIPTLYWDGEVTLGDAANLLTTSMLCLAILVFGVLWLGTLLWKKRK